LQQVWKKLLRRRHEANADAEQLARLEIRDAGMQVSIRP